MWEYQKTRQDSPTLKKRWFYDSDCDLILWQDEAGAIHRFQFCYGKDTPQERVVEYKNGHLMQHDVANPLKPTDQGSPTFTNTQHIAVEEAQRLLLLHAGEVTIDLLYDILQILHQEGLTPPPG